jgi:hypothetical protein
MRKIICAVLIFAFAALEILGLNAAKGNFFARKTQESAENLYSIIVNQSAEIRSGNIDNALASEAKLKDEIAKFKKYSGNNDMAAKLEKYYDFIQSARAMEIAEFNKIIKDLNPTLTSDTDFREKYRSLSDIAENLYGIIVNQSAEIRSGNIDNALASEAKLKDEIAKFKKYSGNNDITAKLEKYYDFVQSARAMEIAEFNKVIKDLNLALTSDTDFKEKYRSLSDIAENLNLESGEELKDLIKKLSSAMRSASHCKDRCGPGEFVNLQQDYTEAKDNLLALVEQMNNNILNDTQTNSLIEELKKLEK